VTEIERQIRKIYSHERDTYSAKETYIPSVCQYTCEFDGVRGIKGKKNMEERGRKKERERRDRERCA